MQRPIKALFAASLLGVTFLQCIQPGTAQVVDVKLTLDCYAWSQSSKCYTVHCIVGTNWWQIDGNFYVNADATYWFTGKEIIEESVVTKPASQELLKKSRLLMTSPPIGTRNIQIFKSLDGNPSVPVGPSGPDRMLTFSRAVWLAFCSAPSLKRSGRQIFPPSDLWKELISAPNGFSDKTETFPDDLGLPRKLDLYTTNDQPVMQYRVTSSTNFMGWNVPLEFYLAQYCPARIPGSNQVGTNAWELEITIKGTTASIGVGTAPKLPSNVQDQLARWRGE